MPRFTYNMLCQSSRKRERNQEAHRQSKKQKKCFFTSDALDRASSANKPYERSQKISLKERGFEPIAMGPQFSLRPQTVSKGSCNRMHKKSRNRGSLAKKQHEERSHIEANKQYEERRSQINKSKLRRMPCTACVNIPRRLSKPFQIGYYSPGTEPDHIPYHLYILVKEAVDIMKHFYWDTNNYDDMIRLTTVERKINFFCTYFHSHLPTGWKYNRKNAISLISGYDTIFPEGGGPRYLMSGYTPLGDQVKEEHDSVIGLSTRSVVDIMRIVHSRKTPTPETFMEWGNSHIIFYCKLCSCLGIDYQHLETASEDDVCLMNMGSS